MVGIISYWDILLVKTSFLLPTLTIDVCVLLCGQASKTDFHKLKQVTTGWWRFPFFIFHNTVHCVLLLFDTTLLLNVIDLSSCVIIWHSIIHGKTC